MLPIGLIMIFLPFILRSFALKALSLILIALLALSHLVPFHHVHLFSNVVYRDSFSNGLVYAFIVPVALLISPSSAADVLAVHHVAAVASLVLFVVIRDTCRLRTLLALLLTTLLVGGLSLLSPARIAFGIRDAAIVHVLAVVIQDAITVQLLLSVPAAFTLGEAVIVGQIITHIIVAAPFKNGPTPLNIQGPLLMLASAIAVALIAVQGIGLFVKSHAQRTAAAAVGWLVAVYCCGIPLPRIDARSMITVAYLGFTLICGIYIATSQISIPVVVRRKIFHILSLVMFVPAFFISEDFTAYALGVVLNIFVALMVIYPSVTHSGVRGFVDQFVDSKSGLPLLSPVYLLAAPIIPYALSGSIYTMVIGAGSVWVCDTFCGIAGLSSRYPAVLAARPSRVADPSSPATVRDEPRVAKTWGGALGGWVAMVVYWGAVVHLLGLTGMTFRGGTPVWVACGSAVLAFVELTTSADDNLVLPLVGAVLAQMTRASG